MNYENLMIILLKKKKTKDLTKSNNSIERKREREGESRRRRNCDVPKNIHRRLKFFNKSKSRFSYETTNQRVINERSSEKNQRKILENYETNFHEQITSLGEMNSHVYVTQQLKNKLILRFYFLETRNHERSYFLFSDLIAFSRWNSWAEWSRTRIADLEKFGQHSS